MKFFDFYLQAMRGVIGFYKENTSIIMDTFNSLGFNVYGGKNAPYVWVHFPGRSSWDVFAEILEKTHVVTTPGSGFGPGGEGFIRVSAFGHRENVLEACRRFKQLYKWKRGKKWCRWLRDFKSQVMCIQVVFDICLWHFIFIWNVQSIAVLVGGDSLHGSKWHLLHWGLYGVLVYLFFNK